jgi:nucleotide-binding universal stress UspA family protein
MMQVFKSLLCPVDLEAPSKSALEMAHRLAQQNGAPVCLLHVITLPLEGTVEPSPEWENSVKSRLEKVAREHFADGMQCDIKILRGEASSAIIRAALDIKADLIVMATHKYTGLNRLLLGSVAERVVREAPVPVLAVGSERNH